MGYVRVTDNVCSLVFGPVMIPDPVGSNLNGLPSGNENNLLPSPRTVCFPAELGYGRVRKATTTSRHEICSPTEQGYGWVTEANWRETCRLGNGTYLPTTSWHEICSPEEMGYGWVTEANWWETCRLGKDTESISQQRAGMKFAFQKKWVTVG